MNKSRQKKGFTARELSLLRGNYKPIARKHGVTNTYVAYIAKGKVPVNTRTARAIFRDLEKLLETLKEISR